MVSDGCTCTLPDGDNGPDPYRDPNCPLHGIEAHAAELKKRHLWEIEEVDSGHLGVNDFWRCRRCDAAGGSPYYHREPDGSYRMVARGKELHLGEFRWDRPPPFYADGSGLQLTDDCVESDRLILEHFKKTVAKLYAEGFGRELALEFEVAVSTVKRWADGVVAPLPRIRKLVIQACREILEKELR